MLTDRKRTLNNGNPHRPQPRREQIAEPGPEFDVVCLRTRHEAQQHCRRRPAFGLPTNTRRQSKVIHTDDTTLSLVDPLAGRRQPARFWAYIGDAAGPYSVYGFTESRERDGPAK